MKLSEAIRLGAMMHPQAFRKTVVCDEYGKVVATCALGAARVAGYNTSACDALLSKRISLSTREVGFKVTVSSVIIHLNDECRWSRERIADWVETIEASHAPHDPLSTPAGATDARPSEPCGAQALATTSS